MEGQGKKREIFQMKRAQNPSLSLFKTERKAFFFFFFLKFIFFFFFLLFEKCVVFKYFFWQKKTWVNLWRLQNCQNPNFLNRIVNVVVVVYLSQPTRVITLLPIHSADTHWPKTANNKKKI